MNFHMSAPSKTYLTGEYAVLVGGPALVLNTPPRFEFTAVKQRSLAGPVIKGIPEGSPASVWLRQRQPLLEGWTLEFKDPHQKRGGFGASGAQFLFCHTFTTMLQYTNSSPVLNAEDVFNDYQVCSGGVGSGADILAQLKGSVTSVDIKNVKADALAWPYPELGFAIVRTGTKLPTHLHLQNLKRDSLKELIGPAQDCVDSFGKSTWREFAGKVREYEAALRGLDLQVQRTTGLLEAFKSQAWCLAAKGCGAWGADTILLMYEKGNGPEAAEFAETQGLPFVTAELSTGLEVVNEAN